MEGKLHIKMIKVILAAEGAIMHDLDKTITRTNIGFTLEGNQRHAKDIVQATGLDTTTAKGADSPGQKRETKEHGEESEPLGAQRAAEFRTLVGKAMHASLDRSDIT